MFFSSKPMSVPSAAEALAGRDMALEIEPTYFVSGRPFKGPYPDGAETIYFGLGCFWGAERLFWRLDGVWVTAAGYQGGHTRNPTYKEVCSGRTGHAETVMVVYEPARIDLSKLLKVFWEEHDPTQGMRQGNDVGTQYRSAIYWSTDAQRAAIEASRASYDKALRSAGQDPVTTELARAGPFYFAETDHQQYLAKNPNGYCGLRGTGVSCTIGGV